MDLFLQLLIHFLSSSDIVPPEVRANDTDRVKSYLYDLPDRANDPDTVYAFRNYLTRHASGVATNIGTKWIQVLIRSQSQKDAYSRIHKLYDFLLQLSEIKNGNITYMDEEYWGIFSCAQGPVKSHVDEHGRHIWSLSFTVRTNLI